MSTATDYVIECEVVIEAPSEVVWRTVTEPEQISQWFADRIELELVPGGRGTFVFEHDDRPPTNAPLVVEAVEPPARFAFRWSQPDGETATPANSLLVEFTLIREGDEQTRLRVVETDLDLVAWPAGEKERYASDHRRGWAEHTDRLVRLFTGRR